MAPSLTAAARHGMMEITPFFQRFTDAHLSHKARC
jgi:hypothetical protein